MYDKKICVFVTGRRESGCQKIRTIQPLFQGVLFRNSVMSSNSGRVGLQVVAVQRDVAELEQLESAGQLQHIDKALICLVRQLAQVVEPATKGVRQGLLR